MNGTSPTRNANDETVDEREEDVVQVQDKRIEIVPAWKYVQ